MKLQREEIEVIKYCGLTGVVAMAMPKCHFFYVKKQFKLEDQLMLQKFIKLTMLCFDSYFKKKIKIKQLIIEIGVTNIFKLGFFMARSHIIINFFSLV